MGYLEPPRPRVFGHRGAAALAPENTLVSFAIAAQSGAGYLELDVHGTADGTIVVLHDDTLDRTTDGSGPVSEVPWRQVERLDAGHRFQFEPTDSNRFPYRGQGVRVPTLESVLREFPDHHFNIEIKQADPAIVDEVVALVRASGVGRQTLLAAERDDIMAEIRRASDGEIATGSSVGDVLAFFAALDAGTLEAYRHPGVALQIPTHVGERTLVDRRSVDAAHAKGIEVHVWTINDAGEIDDLLDLGVDGIMSDAPGLVATAIARRL